MDAPRRAMRALQIGLKLGRRSTAAPHRDLRNTPAVRAVMDFVATVISESRDLSLQRLGLDSQNVTPLMDRN